MANFGTTLPRTTGDEIFTPARREDPPRRARPVPRRSLVLREPQSQALLSPHPQGDAILHLHVGANT